MISFVELNFIFFVTGKNLLQDKSIDEFNSSRRENRTELKLILTRKAYQSQFLRFKMIILENVSMDFQTETNIYDVTELTKASLLLNEKVETSS